MKALLLYRRWHKSVTLSNKNSHRNTSLISSRKQTQPLHCKPICLAKQVQNERESQKHTP